MAQQTSVQWLVEKLQESGINFLHDELEMIKQAKEMHKAEIINAYDNVIINDLEEFLNGEQYYNETFKTITWHKHQKKKQRNL